MEKTKAKGLLDYCNDLFFKYTLSREDEASVYARNTIIQRTTGIHVKESTVLNPNLDPGTIGKKRVILDVHVKDELGQHFNMEMQTTYAGLSEMMRFEFYGARALNNQLKSGELYHQLKPVYQIIFINEYAWHNKSLINHYQMRNKRGEEESRYPLIRRTFIHLPVINDIAKEKGIQKMDDFEQLCFLFENNANNAILKTKERLVRIFMEKYKEMQQCDELWSTAMAIQMGEARYRNGLHDSFEEGMAKGREEGMIEGEKQLLQRQLETKYHEACTSWLGALNAEQISAVSNLILVCDTLQEIKCQIEMNK